MTGMKAMRLKWIAGGLAVGLGGPVANAGAADTFVDPAIGDD